MNSIKNLNNPAEFNNFRKRIEKAAQQKGCSYFDTTNCTKNIVKAHTLSKEAVLSKIEEEQHIYSVNKANPPQEIEIKREGRNEATTFSGFCSHHDTELFKCLDNEPFTCTDEQLFMLAYRSLCREYFKLGLIEARMPTEEEFLKIHGINKQNPEFKNFREFINEKKEPIKNELETFKEVKLKFDSFLLNKAWNKLYSEVLIFKIDDKPNFAATGAFIPKNIGGNSLICEQIKFQETNGYYPVIIVSLIPTDKYYFAIFSSLEESKGISEKLINSIKKQNNKALAIFNLILDRVENFVLRPSWFKSLGNDEKEFLNKKIRSIDLNFIDNSNNLMERHINWKFCNLRTKLFSKFRCKKFLE